MGLSLYHLADIPELSAVPSPLPMPTLFIPQADTSDWSYHNHKMREGVKEFETAVKLLQLKDADIAASALCNKL
jgi:hypothetical protein